MKNLNALFFILFLTLFLLPTICQSQVAKTGEHVILKKESPHPYAAAEKKGTITWSQTIKYTEKECAFIAIHFKKFKLAKGDTLIVRSPDNSRKYEYDSEANYRRSFWSIQINGNEAIIEIVSNNEKSDYGYKIDKIARGYTNDEQKLHNSYPYKNNKKPRLKTIINENATFQAEVEGTWQMVSLGERMLNENESGTITFTSSEIPDSRYLKSIAATIGCNNVVKYYTIKNTDIMSHGINRGEEKCTDLLELEKEMKSHFLHRRLIRFKFVNRLLFLIDEEDRISFILKRKKS